MEQTAMIAATDTDQNRNEKLIFNNICAYHDSTSDRILFILGVDVGDFNRVPC